MRLWRTIREQSRNPTVLIWAIPSSLPIDEAEERLKTLSRNPTVLIWSIPRVPQILACYAQGIAPESRNPTVLIWAIRTAA